MSPYSHTAIPASNFGPLTSNSYSLHERQSFFANSLKTKDGVNFYSLQKRPFLKKKRTPDEGVRPDRVGTNVLPDEGLRPPHGFGGRSASPARMVRPARLAQSDSEGSGRNAYPFRGFLRLRQGNALE